MRKEKTIKLIGGSRNGEEYIVWNGQPVIIVYKRITKEEYNSLKTPDPSIMWKAPEDVYSLNLDGQYYFDRTINYKPELV